MAASHLVFSSFVSSDESVTTDPSDLYTIASTIATANKLAADSPTHISALMAAILMPMSVPSLRTKIIDAVMVSNPREVGYVDKIGNTALMYACRVADVESIRRIVQSPYANVGNVNHRGETALIILAKYGRASPECFRLLINTGASLPDHEDNDGNNALYYTSNSTIIKILLEVMGTPIIESMMRSTPRMY